MSTGFRLLLGWGRGVINGHVILNSLLVMPTDGLQHGEGMGGQTRDGICLDVQQKNCIWWP